MTMWRLVIMYGAMLKIAPSLYAECYTPYPVIDTTTPCDYHELNEEGQSAVIRMMGELCCW